MTRPTTIAALALVTVVAAACSTGSSTSPAAVASSAPTETTPASASPKPSARPTATPLPEGTFQVNARQFSFQPKSLTVEAGKPFTIILKNSDDSGVLHDVDIRAKADGTVLVDQTEIDGGQTAEYEYPQLEAGRYVFICSIHPIPGMTGALTVT